MNNQCSCFFIDSKNISLLKITAAEVLCALLAVYVCVGYILTWAGFNKDNSEFQILIIQKRNPSNDTNSSKDKNSSKDLFPFPTGASKTSATLHQHLPQADT